MMRQHLQVTDCSDKCYTLTIIALTIIFLFPGHEVVCRPVPHSTFNRFELTSAQVSGHITANAKVFNLIEEEQMAGEGFGIVTADCWCKLIRHMREKDKDLTSCSDCLCKQYITLFIAQFGGDLASSDTTNSDDSDSDHDSDDGDTSDGNPGSDSDNCVCSCEDRHQVLFPPSFPTRHFVLLPGFSKSHSFSLKILTGLPGNYQYIVLVLKV